MLLPASVMDDIELYVEYIRSSKYNQVLLMMGEKNRPKHVRLIGYK
jgi:hypothetical protein